MALDENGDTQMTYEATTEAARIVIDSALEFMSNKAGIPIGALLDAMLASPEGAAASRFRELIRMGITEVDNFLDANAG